MLEPLFTRPYGQEIAKRFAQNFESGYIKAKYCIHNTSRTNQHLKINIHRAKECSKIWEVPFLSENSVFIFHP